MKRIKKVMFLLLFIILLTGCSVNYKLTINQDGTVAEKVVAKEITNRMKTRTGLDQKQSVKYLYSMFNRDNLKTHLSFKNEDSYTVATVTGYHDSVKKYSKNFKSDIFEKAEYSEKDGIVTLRLDQSKVLSTTSSKSMVYDDIIVSIEIPYKVVEHNADAHQRKIYTWNIKKDKDLKKIKISYKKDELVDTKIFKFGKYKFSLSYQFMVISSIILIIAAIAVFVYINNKKNNRV